MRLLIVAAAALMACAAPVSAQWHQAKTRHFIIYSEQKPAELKAYAERLTRALDERLAKEAAAR